MATAKFHTHTLGTILKSTDYGLDIFTEDERKSLKIIDKRGKAYLIDFVTGIERPAKPEEIVRQLYVYRLMHTYKYPRERITLEKSVQFGSSVSEKRADIFVADASDPKIAYLIVETKKPKRKDGVEQLKSYCNAEGAPIAVWTNGGEEVILHREEANKYRSISALPHANQTLTEIINERVTLAELRRNNKLHTERWTLKKIILDLENLVLANSGVDAFEEVFKLIYAKLYDEWKAQRRSGKFVEFRASGETHLQLYDKINGLFNDAKSKWQGVFAAGDKIDLSPPNLAVCVSFLQDIALFHSNLQVIDEAFEYLVTQVSKGAKGQYFTPRHVIDMCVTMLNPKWEERMIDTAAGSCGFTVHSIFHVWGGQLTSEEPNHQQIEYASEMVYGLDFDSRSVKIARALNLIAGDGKTNVYRVNTLNAAEWDESARVGLRPRLQRFSDSSQDDWNQKNFRYFDFDVLLTNPPFAGDIKDQRLLHQYELAKKWRSVDLKELESDAQAREQYAADPLRHAFRDTGKWAEKQSRDVLFIERNLQFVKPGGRLALVLPQGRFNNITDGYVRNYISKHCRILAVVGLHTNTFKPHTNTKTSVLFLQKWNEDPEVGPLCPRTDDYPIFFATSHRSGKDNSGEYAYCRSDDGQPVLNVNGQLVVDHDLNEIAEAFIVFAREQQFSFQEDKTRPF